MDPSGLPFVVRPLPLAIKCRIIMEHCHTSSQGGMDFPSQEHRCLGVGVGGGDSVVDSTGSGTFKVNLQIEDLEQTAGVSRADTLNGIDSSQRYPKCTQCLF